MPIVRLSAEDANRNLRRNRASLWPDGRVPTGRLADLARVSFNPTFTFSKSDRILTIGSCFAREMERRLASLGFDLPMTRVVLPQEERATKTENDILIKFTTESIENELVWARDPSAQPPPEQLFLQVGEDLWHDPQLVNNVYPASLERVIERRDMVRAAFQQAPSCKIVIITLGLAEAWFDHETGLYLNTAPPPQAMKRHPTRFSLDVLSYEDIDSALEKIWGHLKAFGHPEFKILITVSPVPFKATFTGQDAITANTYSKSVQRAACAAFVARHDNVDYFPSYEIVTMSDRELVYEKDNVHIGSPTVAYIVDQVLSQYTPDLQFKPARVAAPRTRREGAQDKHLDLFVLAKHHLAEGDYDKAVQACDEVMDRFYDSMSAWDKNSVHVTYGVALTRLRNLPEAAPHFEKACELFPQYADNWLKLGQTYLRMGRKLEAVNALQRAADINPHDEDCRRALNAARSSRSKTMGAGLLGLVKPNGSSDWSEGLFGGLRRVFGSTPRSETVRE
jgi:tetratricopeptide (TPR) repeat protein